MPTSHSDRVLAAVYDNTPVPLAMSATPRPTPLVIVASPRSQSGKTLLARLLVDYLRLDGGAVSAFDLNPDDFPLAASRPAVTAQCEIATTPAAVTMFDQLVVNDGVPKVVDIGEAWYWRFFSLCEEVGFVEETRRRGFNLVILFPAEANAAASLAYDKLRRQLSRVLVVAVLNEAILQGRKVRDHYPFVRSAAMPLQIPTLPPALKTHAERSALTFTEFHAQLPMSVPMRHA